MERRAILTRGIVQGVGFRPFVYNRATRLRLGGFVRNQTGTVLIEVEGDPPSLVKGKAMTTRYRVDPGPSRFTVQAFATGLLSVFAHSPTFAVREYQGEVQFEDDFGRGSVVLTVRADSLDLVDNVRPADRNEILSRMRGEVLETATFPEIVFEAADVAARAIAGNRYRLRVNGVLSLHGVANRLALEAEMLTFDDGIRVTGGTGLRLPDYRIRPVTALGGAIRLRDEMRVDFDLAAWKEG